MVSSADILPITASLLAVIGCVVLRHSWSLPSRSARWNSAGWAMFAAASIAAWISAGAWGVAVASLWGMGAASVLLTHAAWQSPAPKPANPARAPRAPKAPPPAPLHLGRRIGTFVMVCLAALIVSVGFAVAVRALLIGADWSEANALAAALTTMPLLWTWLSYDLLMKEKRIMQFRTLALYALPGAIMLGLGLRA